MIPNLENHHDFRFQPLNFGGGPFKKIHQQANFAPRMCFLGFWGCGRSILGHILATSKWRQKINSVIWLYHQKDFGWFLFKPWFGMSNKHWSFIWGRRWPCSKRTASRSPKKFRILGEIQPSFCTKKMSTCLTIWLPNPQIIHLFTVPQTA